MATHVKRLSKLALQAEAAAAGLGESQVRHFRRMTARERAENLSFAELEIHRLQGIGLFGIAKEEKLTELQRRIDYLKKLSK